MNFRPNKTLVQVIKNVLLVILILKTFILILIKNGIKIHEKNLLIKKILILNFMHQIIVI